MSAIAEVLLDTNAAIAWIADDLRLFSSLATHSVLAVSIITVGELEFGASKSARVEANRQRFAHALAQFVRLTLDDETARICGEVNASLRKKGRPIPTNDVWIAALALQHGMPVLTRDAHFRDIAGLGVRGW